MILMRYTAVLLSMALLAGCVTIGGDEPVDRRVYDILPATGEDGGGADEVVAAGPEVLQVESFSMDPTLDRDELVWRRGDIESGAWANHFWSRPPAAIVRAAVAAALREAAVCAVVASDPEAPDPDLRLRGHLERFGEYDGEVRWYGVAAVTITVEDSSSNEVFRRTYRRREAADERNPPAVAEALRRALLDIGAELATDLGDMLEARRGP